MQSYHCHLCLVLTVLLGLAGPAAGAGETNDSPWRSEAHFGFDMNQGNGDTIGLRVGAQSKRSWDGRDFVVEAEYVYGETDDVKSADRFRATTDYNWPLSDRFYVNMRAEYSFDDIADIDYRAIVGPPSLGYYIWKTDTGFLGTEIGLAYLWERVADVRDDGFRARFKQMFERHLSETARLWQSFEYLPALEEFNDYLLNAEIGIHAALNSHMGLRAVVQDRYNSLPAPGKKDNDLSTFAALTFTY